MTRAFRRCIARLGIVALLFMQLAVAASSAPVVLDLPPEFLAHTTAPLAAIRFGVFRS